MAFVVRCAAAATSDGALSYCDAACSAGASASSGAAAASCS